MNNINKALTIMCLFMFSIRPAISEDGINMKKLMTKYRLPKEAVDKDNLRPIYKKLMQEKIRGTYDNIVSYVLYKGKYGIPQPTPELPVKLNEYSFEPIDFAAKMKHNVIIANFYGKYARDFKLANYAQLLVGKACAKRGMQLLVKTNYGTDHCNSYRRYYSGSGVTAKRTPCPLDSEYWRQVVLERAMITAKSSLKEKGIIGHLIDFEMYGSEQTRYDNACMCNDCFKNFLKKLKLESVYDSIEPQNRASWIKLNDLLPLYRKITQYNIYKIVKKIERELHRVNPNMVLATFPGFDWLPGVERGLGTSTQPVIVFSEVEYRAGYSPIIKENIGRIKSEKYPVLYCPGIWLTQHRPEDISGNIFKMADESIGYWVYAFFYIKPRVPKTPVKFAEDYIKAFTKGNEAIVKLAKNPQYKPDFPLPLHKNIKLPTNKVRFAKSSPKIDGKLNDICWKDAGKMIMKESWKGGTYPYLTTAYLSYDNKYLYVAANCTEPATSTMKLKKIKKTFSVFGSEHLEIFIDVNFDRITYYQFGINPKGTIAGQKFVAVGATDKSWRISGIKIATAVNKNNWTMEMAIPLSILGGSKIKPGRTWGININRTRRNSKVAKSLYGAWSPTFGGYHQPPRFGKITF
jgi:cellulose/xylan binding protein with CBM9 domain